MANLDLGCNSFTGWNKITFKDSKLLFNIVNAFLSYHVPHDSMTPLCFNIISGRYTIHSFIKILLFFVKKEPYTFDGKILLKKIRVFCFYFLLLFFSTKHLLLTSIVYTSKHENCAKKQAY